MYDEFDASYLSLVRSKSLVSGVSLKNIGTYPWVQRASVTSPYSALLS